jgi:hypothetical protein
MKTKGVKNERNIRLGENKERQKRKKKERETIENIKKQISYGYDMI